MDNKQNVRSAIYKTKRLYVRGLCLNDINGNYGYWFNDQEVCKYNVHGLFPKTRQELEDYVSSMNKSRDKVVWAIVDINTQTHIGNISLQCIDWIYRSAEFAIIIGERKYWNKGYAVEAGLLLLSHGFEKLNLNRIYCGTAANNLAMQKVADKFGMKREGIRRKALFLNGEYTDLYEYGILRDEYTRSKK